MRGLSVRMGALTDHGLQLGVTSDVDSAGKLRKIAPRQLDREPSNGIDERPVVCVSKTVRGQWSLRL